jgi:hypothetical protein
MPRFRSRPDRFATAAEPRWLVVRDRVSRPVSVRPLPPGADLRAALADERQRLIEAGWRAEPLTRYAFCFLQPDEERWCISIEHDEPGQVPVSRGSVNPPASGGRGQASLSAADVAATSFEQMLPTLRSQEAQRSDSPTSQSESLDSAEGVR